MFVKLVVLTAGLGATMPLAAQTTTSSPPTAAPAKAEKKVCRSEVPTGSIMLGKRTCRTKSEWTAIDAQNRYRVEHRNDASGGMHPGD